MKTVLFSRGKTIDKNSLFLELIVVLLLLLYLHTAVSKLVDLEKFTAAIRKSPLISSYAKLIASGIPFVEILISGMLLFKRTISAALYLSVTAMSMFSAYIYAMLHFSYSLPCNCSGALEQLSWPQHLIFNLSFLGISATGVMLEKRQRTSRS